MYGCSWRRDLGWHQSTLPFPRCSYSYQVRTSLFVNLYYIVCGISIYPCTDDRWYLSAYIVYLAKLSIYEIYPIGGGNFKNSSIGLMLLLYIFLRSIWAIIIKLAHIADFYVTTIARMFFVWYFLSPSHKLQLGKTPPPAEIRVWMEPDISFR